jgi:NAD(P)-dependent dehydrogenase (short-subunit alcohol dehydrogenase family)
MAAPAQTVLITGACGDIGRSLAAEFARNGARLALCDLRSPAEAEPFLAALREQSPQVLYRMIDVTDAAAMGDFVGAAAWECGGLDICIANAGIVERGLLVELDVAAWRRTLEVNLTGCFITAQAAARVMLEHGQGGHILFMSSWVQDVPRETIGAYCASKGGLKMLAKTFALELGPKGLRVNLVAPGWVDAGLTGQNLRAHPELRAKNESQIPLGRLITPEELAQAVRMLTSAEAAYIHGATLLIDGGSSLFFRKPGA